MKLTCIAKAMLPIVTSITL